MTQIYETPTVPINKNINLNKTSLDSPSQCVTFPYFITSLVKFNDARTYCNQWLHHNLCVSEGKYLG